MKLALYKGKSGTVYERLVQRLISFWTNSQYTHAELIINGIWYTSSAADGGVRAKAICPNPDHWDIFDIQFDDEYAINWFNDHLGEKYDYAGVARFVIPILPNASNRWFCFEAVGAMLCMTNTDNFSANSLLKLVELKP